jgi:RNA polymerase sigma-70 factor (ECF subfamily)
LSRFSDELHIEREVKISGSSHSHLTLLPSQNRDATPDIIEAPLTLSWAFRRFAPYVARIGTRILGWSDQEIDDLVQDVFVEAVAGLRRLNQAAAVRGWLATVTVRVATRRLRARRRKQFFFGTAFPIMMEPVSTAASPEQRALIAHVFRCLDQMPARQRAAWVMRHVEEEQLEDVARYCECSLATVKRLIYAAEDWIAKKTNDDPL